MPETDAAGRPVDERDAPAAIQELRCRRPTWSPGAGVFLSDGTRWWLPPIDFALVATCPRFRRDANIALGLAPLVDEASPLAEAAFLRHAVYHSQMAQMGVTLLRQNYSLDDEAWAALVAFPRLAEALRYTRVVAEAFADSTPCWQALLVGGRFVD